MESQQKQIKEWLGSGSLNIFGLPFAGKDTQGSRLAAVVNGVMLSSGDILRHDHGNTDIQRIMAEGGIVTSDLFEQVVVPYLSRPELDGRPLILSEVGRMEGEQQVVMRATEATNHPTKAVILLNMPDKEIWKRFEQSQQSHDRGDRADDNRDVLQKRLDSYKEKVVPVINWYRDKGLLIEIDGTQAPYAVFNAIIDALEARSSS